MKFILIKLVVFLSYGAMIVVNYLANSLPFNNRSTGSISDQYATYFTPAGFTFSIWGAIYITLLVFVIQILFKDNSYLSQPHIQSMIIWFVVSSLFNIAWLFMWHYDYITLSLIVMIGILCSLIMVYRQIPSGETMYLVAFGLYLGWVSVATIANVSIAIVNWNSAFFMNSEVTWFLIVLFVGLGLVTTILYLTGNVVYGLVFVWAYFGIIMKHVQGEARALDVQAPLIVNGLILATIVLVVIYTWIDNGNQVFRI